MQLKTNLNWLTADQCQAKMNLVEKTLNSLYSTKKHKKKIHLPKKENHEQIKLDAYHESNQNEIRKYQQYLDLVGLNPELNFLKICPYFYSIRVLDREKIDGS